MDGQITAVNILKMANGATEERISMAVGDIVENILDLNTDAKLREIDIKLKIKPSDDRKSAGVTALVTTKLRPLTEIQTMIYMGVDVHGEIMAVEATPQTPGQMGLGGEEQEDPKVIQLGAKQA